MPSAKFTQTYEAVSKMGEKLKAAGKQGPSNDEQLRVCLEYPFPASTLNHSLERALLALLSLQQ
jgi:hypothetical protein